MPRDLYKLLNRAKPNTGYIRAYNGTSVFTFFIFSNKTVTLTEGELYYNAKSLESFLVLLYLL